MRAAIYARFSTDLQNERSVEDQIALCEEYARRERLAIVARYADRARSGASILGRDGLLELLDGARAGEFNVVLIEALDRLSRDMEDLAGLHKRLTFLGIEIQAVHEGQVNTVLVGLRGLVGQLYREDNVHKIKRGMAGRVRQGLYAGGLAYGYASVTGNPGQRVIVDHQAEIVRRIFEEYLAGKSPRKIAADLNRDGVQPPRGKSWNASTINGNKQRGYGILHNEIYSGHLVWNRVRMVKDPDTGRRISRVNPKSEWKYCDLPELAIVSVDIYRQAQQLKTVRTKMTPRIQRSPRRLLSGLLRCGACGSGMSISGADKSGRIRVRCTRHVESRTCPDPRSFYIDAIERTVLDGLSQELRDPHVTAEYVRTYHEERQRLAAKGAKQRKCLQRRIDGLKREIDRLVDGIAKGLGDPALLGPRATELHKERLALIETLEQADQPVEAIALHPAVLARYEEQLRNLQRALNTSLSAGDAEGGRVMRELIESVTGPGGCQAAGARYRGDHRTA